MVSGHDFVSMGLCADISHGIYSLKYNGGFMHLNTGHETSELACDSIEAWRKNHGLKTYPKG